MEPALSTPSAPPKLSMAEVIKFIHEKFKDLNVPDLYVPAMNALMRLLIGTGEVAGPFVPVTPNKIGGNSAESDFNVLMIIFRSVLGHNLSMIVVMGIIFEVVRTFCWDTDEHAADLIVVARTGSLFENDSKNPAFRSILQLYNPKNSSVQLNAFTDITVHFGKIQEALDAMCVTVHNPTFTGLAEALAKRVKEVKARMQSVENNIKKAEFARFVCEEMGFLNECIKMGVDNPITCLSLLAALLRIADIGGITPEPSEFRMSKADEMTFLSLLRSRLGRYSHRSVPPGYKDNVLTTIDHMEKYPPKKHRIVIEKFTIGLVTPANAPRPAPGNAGRIIANLNLPPPVVPLSTAPRVIPPPVTPATPGTPATPAAPENP